MLLIISFISFPLLILFINWSAWSNHNTINFLNFNFLPTSFSPRNFLFPQLDRVHFRTKLDNVKKVGWSIMREKIFFFLFFFWSIYYFSSASVKKKINDIAGAT